jgi:hypothetical protein
VTSSYKAVRKPNETEQSVMLPHRARRNVLRINYTSPIESEYGCSTSATALVALTDFIFDVKEIRLCGHVGHKHSAWVPGNDLKH